MTGIEPVTSSLPRKYSTPELHRQKTSENVTQKRRIDKTIFTNLSFWLRAGDEIRTRDPQLGRLMLYQLSYSRINPVALKLLLIFDTTK
jgi:hypothetical protein